MCRAEPGRRREDAQGREVRAEMGHRDRDRQGGNEEAQRGNLGPLGGGIQELGVSPGGHTLTPSGPFPSTLTWSHRVQSQQPHCSLSGHPRETQRDRTGGPPMPSGHPPTSALCGEGLRLAKWLRGPLCPPRARSVGPTGLRRTQGPQCWCRCARHRCDLGQRPCISLSDWDCEWGIKVLATLEGPSCEGVSPPG